MTKTFLIEFSEQEFQALSGLVDAGLKSVGLAGAHASSAILAKMEQSAAEAEAEAKAAAQAKAPVPVTNGHDASEVHAQ